MEDKKVLEVVSIYERYFKVQDIPKIDYPHNQLFQGTQDALAHCHSMLQGIREFMSLGDKDKRDRALKRLGFIEGCLATARRRTVKELKEINRPNEGTINPQTHEPLTQEDFQDWEY